jgi:BirA family biotin operon repressor/biotin-[acetyl-CoA-carboxylase] ligase
VGHAAELRLPVETLHGLVLGISDAGMLRMTVDGAEREFASGDLSLRIR